MAAFRERQQGSSDQNEGEGSRTAARRYEQGVRQTVAAGQVDEAARAAAKALDGAEGASLRRAEVEAKRHKASGPHRSVKAKKH